MSSTMPAPAVILSGREICWSEFMASLSVLRGGSCWVRWPDRHAPALQGRFNRVTPPARQRGQAAAPGLAGPDSGPCRAGALDALQEDRADVRRAGADLDRACQCIPRAGE